MSSYRLMIAAHYVQTLKYIHIVYVFSRIYPNL